MIRTVFDTPNYKRVNLYETETTKIVFVKCKSDNKYDKIKFVKLGNEYKEPEVVVVYRYEDEQLIEGMLNTYGYKE